MPKYREALPQLGNKLFLTDGGLETTLVFHDKIDLPCFAAFDLLKHEWGRERIRDYYRQYASIAVAQEVGFILESVTWRANRDWGPSSATRRRPWRRRTDAPSKCWSSFGRILKRRNHQW
jgi:S-methylmethionine-dependent homocysteine/selenocysteine methylase